jgi:hypothetical protein
MHVKKTSSDIFNNSKNSLATESYMTATTVKMNKYVKSPTNNHKPYLEAVDQYKKLCLKVYATENPSFVSVLKNESLNICLDVYNLKEISIMNKIIGSFYYFKQIVLAPCDVNSKNKY